jgi:hypothetical protein
MPADDGRPPMMFEDRGGYSIAEKKAIEELALVDPATAAAERGVEFDSLERVFHVPFLGETLTVAFPSGEIALRGGKVSGAAAILALHYLVYHGEPLRADGWLAYRDMPGARHFASAFEAMAENRIALHFGERASDFEAAARSLGGKAGEAGDCSFVIPALPRVPVLAVFWAAGEEGAGAARLLFLPSAPYYFHSEDLAALGVVAAERLVAADLAAR